jgi:hypothetical protein
MDGAQLGDLLLLATLIFGLLSSVDSVHAQSVPSYRYYIGLDQARTDATLPESIRSAEDDWDEEAPLESVAADLDGDGISEKLVPNRRMAGAGGCPWVIYSVARDTVIGQIQGAIIYIQTNQAHGHAILECYWKLGAGEATVATYEFDGNQYTVSRELNLTDDQIDKYFQERKSVRPINELPPGK